MNRARMNCTALLALAASAGLSSAQTTYTVPGPSGESLKFYLESGLSPLASGDTLILTDAGSYQTTYIISDAGLTIRAADGQNITIDGQFAGSVFEIMAPNTTLEGLTIRGGLADIDGGAVRCLDQNLTIRDCRFENNFAPDDGGAIVFSDATLLIEDSHFIGNETMGLTTQSAGGAIQSVRGNITLRRCTFSGNIADYAGGALHIADSDARYQIESCVFEANTARFGGAIWWVTAAEGDVFDSSFLGNIAGADGGAVYHNSAPATYTRCEFIANKTEGAGADDGGAVYITGETANEVVMTSCLLAGNIANSSGGAMEIISGPDPTFLNCTLVDNVAIGAVSANGGGAVHTSGAGATGNFRNCIVRGNMPDQFSGPAALFYSNVEGGSGGTVIDADPLFVNAAGGDYRLMDASPSIDAGNTNNYSTQASPTDLDGNRRAVSTADAPTGAPLLGLFVDQGAYEFQPEGGASLPGCSVADIAEPYNVLDFSDVIGFLGAFGAGCP
ncbi:MAG: right-handed parallel beta-helix repeat-containing protein [Phycisphaerales bacterium JB059]